MIIEEDIYLEHFGVKGMKWGVQNSDSSSRKKTRKKPKTSAQKHKRNERIQKTVYYTAAAVYVAAYLGAFGSTKTSAAKPSPARAKSAVDLIKDRQKVEVSSLDRMFREGQMDSNQLKNFKTILNARYDRKVATALKGGV